MGFLIWVNVGRGGGGVSGVLNFVFLTNWDWGILISSMSPYIFYDVFCGGCCELWNVLNNETSRMLVLLRGGILYSFFLKGVAARRFFDQHGQSSSYVTF